MAYYYPEQERLFLTGLSETEKRKVRKRRQTVCASKKAQYAWLRIDPCTTLPDVKDEDVPVMRSSREVSQFLHKAVNFQGRGIEYFMVLCLNVGSQPMAVAVPHKGGRASSVVDPTVVFQAVILSNASRFVIAHNHPSENPQPSPADIAITQRLVTASSYVGLEFLDHIILTDYPLKYSSFMDMGIMPAKGKEQ